MFEIWYEIVIVDLIAGKGHDYVVISNDEEMNDFIGFINEDSTFSAEIVNKYKVEI